MIKLLLLIPTLDRSGAEKQLTLLATGLPKDEFDVHVVCLTRGGPYEDMLKVHDVRCTVLGKRLKFDPVALMRLRKLIHTEAPDVVHSWLFAANSYLRLVAGKRDRPKVIVSERCVDTWKSGWQLWLDRKQIKRTHWLVANSKSVAAFYRELGYPAERIVVIPNGVDVAGQAFQPDASGQSASTAQDASGQAGKPDLRNQFDIPRDHKVIGYIGRLARQKRVPDLIWAMQLLKQLRERVQFLIVGDGPERKKCEDLAQHMGCDDLVHFAGHREDAAEFYSAIDVFWLASDFEGMSNSLMEAMAAGVPPIATDIPPNRELIEHGKTGYLVEPGNSHAFAQQTDRLLADAELYRSISEAARERMRSEFGVERMVERYSAVYREVCAAVSST